MTFQCMDTTHQTKTLCTAASILVEVVMNMKLFAIVHSNSISSLFSYWPSVEQSPCTVAVIMMGFTTSNIISWCAVVLLNTSTKRYKLVCISWFILRMQAQFAFIMMSTMLPLIAFCRHWWVCFLSLLSWQLLLCQRTWIIWVFLWQRLRHAEWTVCW